MARKDIFLVGEIGWEITLDSIKEKIDLSSTDDLRIFAYSPGGNVQEAMVIYDYLIMYKGQIEFVIFGFTGSAMGYLIFAGQKRSAFENSMWHGHKIQNYVYGDSNTLRLVADLSDRQETAYVNTLEKNMTFSREEIENNLKSDWFIIGSDELLKAGIIDHVYTSAEEIDFSPEYMSYADNINIEIVTLRNKLESQLSVLNAKMKKIGLSETEVQRMVAYFNPKEKNLDNQNGFDNNTNKEFYIMQLKEMLDKHPELKTEIDNMISEGVREKITGFEKDTSGLISQEQKRICDILELEQVQLSQEAIEALDGKKTTDEYMRAKLLAQKEKREIKKPITFGKLKSGQTPGDQSPVDKDDEIDENPEEFFKNATQRAKTIFGNSRIRQEVK